MAYKDILDLDNTLEYNDIDFNNDLIVFKEIIKYAKDNNIHTIDELVDLDDDIFDVFDYLDSRVTNTNVMKLDMKDLSMVLDLYNQLVEIFNLDEDYLSLVTQKMSILFKMKKNDLAEECMMEYIRKNPDDGCAYLELMFALDAIARDQESAIYYGNLALDRENVTERESIEDFLSDLE